MERILKIDCFLPKLFFLFPVNMCRGVLCIKFKLLCPFSIKKERKKNSLVWIHIKRQLVYIECVLCSYYLASNWHLVVGCLLGGTTRIVLLQLLVVVRASARTHKTVLQLASLFGTFTTPNRCNPSPMVPLPLFINSFL